MSQEFGDAYGKVLVADLVIAELGDVTAAEALANGQSARTVWLALCRASGVPENRRHGVGLPEPKQE